VLFGFFSRVSGFTDAARCASTCRRWDRVVATRAAPSAVPSGFLPHLAIGAFLQENDRCACGGGPALLIRPDGIRLAAARSPAAKGVPRSTTPALSRPATAASSSTLIIGFVPFRGFSL
jgi:hypothetical protein